jgi:magnesium and cobalt transporter
MSDDHPSGGAPAPRSFLERLGQALAGEPRNRAELLEELRTAQANGLLSPDTLAMIEGAIAVSDQQVSDVMVPRAHMVCVPVDATLSEVLDIVVESGHSRFPVTGEDRDEVLGILLAKDLLKVLRDGATSIDLRALLRPVSRIPESKRLNVLLKEFRQGRRHMAIVVDEYGGVAGLVTIEDVLEEIVGDISDETDDEDPSALIQAQPDGRFLVAAQTPIEAFNARFGTNFPDEDFDTVGGLVTDALGHLPKAGETARLGDYVFAVTKADNRRLIQLAVEPPSARAA